MFGLIEKIWVLRCASACNLLQSVVGVELGEENEALGRCVAGGGGIEKPSLQVAWAFSKV
jgi:hypothetical protein